MASLPPLPSGFVLESSPRRDPWEVLQEEGFTANNGFRTVQDRVRIRRQGYNPAPNGAHEQGDGVDLDHPSLSRRQQARRLRELFGDWPGAVILDEGHHRHLALPGWGAAPGTPGTPNSGLPPMPEGFTLEQRGSLRAVDWSASRAAPPPASGNALVPPPPQWHTPAELEAIAPGPAAEPPRALPPPRQFRGDPAPHRTLAPTTDTGPVPDDARVIPITTRDDPRLAGVNDRVRAMIADPQFTMRNVADYLGQYGINARQIPNWRALIAWRASPEFARWRRAPPAERRLTVNLDDVVLPPEQQGDVVATAGPPPPASSASIGSDFQETSIASHDPNLAESAGAGVQSVLEPLFGRHSAAEAGRNATDFLTQITPVGAVDLANEYEAANQRAVIEGRYVDALGNSVARDANMLLALPIIGAARAPARAAAERALGHIGEIAARHGIRDLSGAADAEIADAVRRDFHTLPEEVRQFIAGDRAVGDAVPDIDLDAIRREAVPGPSLFERGAGAVRRGVQRLRGGRGGAEALEGSASPAAMARGGAGGPVPELPAATLPGRAVDRIDVNALPPLPPGFVLEEPLGRVAPLGLQPDPADMAAAARAIRPEDVTPIPGNRIESADEAARANPGTIRDVDAPDPRHSLEMRYLPHPSRSGETLGHRGPLDAEAYLRYRGGLRDDGGDLAHIGITNNAARPEAPGDRSLGPILSPEGMSLDEAGDALRAAGYFHERPTVDEVVEMLRASRIGRRTWHADDLEEIERFEGARAQRFQADAAAQEGRPIAERVGEPAGRADLDALDPPATAYEDLPSIGGTVGNINLANIESAGDIRRLLQNVESRFGGFDAARRGVVTHAETRALADELGMTADDLLRRRRGQALNAEQALAARQLMARSADEVLALASRATGPDASEVSRAAFSQALLRHAAIHEQVVGATAEMGRAFGALRIAARSRAVSGRIHQAVIDGMGGEGRLDDIAGAILDLQRQGVSPGGLNRFAVEAVKPRFSDKLVELWYNSLLSGPQTHVVNTLSNAMTQTLQLPEQLVAAGIGAVRRGVRAARGQEDDFDRVLFSELGPRAIGLMQGAREGVRSFSRTLRTGDVPDFVTKVESRSQRAISGLKGEVVRIPSRLLAAEDEFFKATARRMELNGLAVRQARREGLKGQAARARIAELSVNPTDEMLERALATARYLTFQKPLGAVGQRLSATTRDHPWMKLFLPFVRTPTNIFKYAVSRSPLAPLLREVRDDFRAGGERRSLALARISLGTGLGMLIAHWAADGTITGAAPRDRARRDLMLADGWQPYSIRIGGTYYSYQRLDPLAMTLGVAADLRGVWDTVSRGGWDEAGALIIGSVIGNLSNKTFLSGFESVLGVLDDPDRNLSNFVSRLAGSLAVPTGVAQVARTLDPTLRETRGEGVIDSALKRIQSRIPGLSDDLQARRDVWGREIVGGGGLGPDIASPIWTSTARNDPVTRELLNVEAAIGRPSRTLGGRRLSSEEYGAYQETAGRYIRGDLVEAMRDPEWADSDDEERRQWVSNIARDARADARADLGLTSDDDDEAPPRPAAPLGPGLPPLPAGLQLQR